MTSFENDRRLGTGEEFNKGRMYVMSHLDDYDDSYWYGVINALKSQGIRESKKQDKAIREAQALVNDFLKTL